MFKKINQPYTYKFNTPEDGFFCLSVTATCKSGKILGLFGGEDLRVEIDGMKFRELPPENRAQYYNIPPAWNGTKLKGLDKIVMFVLELKRGITREWFEKNVVPDGKFLKKIGDTYFYWSPN